MRPSEVAEILRYSIKNQLFTWIHGSPGIGKTTIVQAVSKELGYECPAFPPAVTLDPVDLRGVPSIQDGSTLWNPPDFWPKNPDWKGVIFVDELPQAPVAVQAAFLQVMGPPYRLGGYTLPKEAVFVVCGNRESDRAGASRTISPLLNRFLHVDMEVSVDDWTEYMSANGKGGLITSFMRFRPSMLNTFDSKTYQRSFGTPRSWERVADVSVNAPPNLLHSLSSGLVGEGEAAEFTAFAKMYMELAANEPARILASPETAKVPDEPSVLWAVCGALVEYIRKDAKQIGQLVKYSMRMSDEQSIAMIRDITGFNRKVLEIPESGPWLKKFGPMLRAAAGG